ncbi:MAG: hypothetical protein PHD02_00025 [Bacilli bacterium]|nr:hypothetical protein [Bacilli bacterium]
MENKKENIKLTPEEGSNLIEKQINQKHYMFWKYNYEKYNENWNYDLKEFKKVDKSFGNKNPRKLSNYEQFAGDCHRLVVPKTFIQAFDDPEIAILLAEYARYSMTLPVNKYGFYSIAYSTIEKDIRLSEYKQRKISNYLAQRGYIDIKSYNYVNSNVEYIRFYRFNDDFTLKKLKEYREKSFVETPYIDKQD